MKIRYIFLIALINFILQCTWFQFFRPFQIMPNTSLILIVVFCALYMHNEGFIMAIFCALFQDLFLSQMLGVHLMIYLIIGSFIVSFREMIFSDNVLTPFIFIIFSTAIFHVIWLSIMFIFGAIVNLEQIVNVILIEMIENGIIGIFIYGFLLKKIHGYGLR